MCTSMKPKPPDILSAVFLFLPISKETTMNDERSLMAGINSSLAKNPDTLGSLLDNVAEARKIYRPAETVRPDYYRFENER